MHMTFDIDPERRQEIARQLRRIAIVLVPGIGLAVLSMIFIWTVRRQLGALADGLVIEPPAEETDETPTEVAPV
jgi:hypothetical protein